jgi:hypothetical protein
VTGVAELQQMAREITNHTLNLTEYYSFLKGCIENRCNDGLDAVKLLFQDMYGGNTFNLFYKWPAAHCLIAWREEGLSRLITGAIELPTSKNVGLVFEVLGGVAAGFMSGIQPVYGNDAPLRNFLFRTVGENLKAKAYHLLREYVMSFDDEKLLAMHIGSAYTTFSMADS